MKIGKDKTTAVDPLKPADGTEYQFGVIGSPDEVELREARAMVYLPENAVEVEIKAKVWQDGQIYDVRKRLEMKDVRQAIRKADEGYIDDDDTFVLTDKGREWLEEMQKK